MKRIFVKNLREHVNEEIEDYFLVANVKIKKKKDGGDYLDLVLSDATGSVPARVFDNIPENLPHLKEGQVARVRGLVDQFRDEVNRKIIEATREENFEIRDFIPTTSRDIERMVLDLHRNIERVTNPHLKELLKRFFNDPEFMEKFKMAPAAKANHHAYIGGLLEHTLNVTELCISIASRYKEVNFDVLITGALLHDIGKVEEYSYFPRIDRTDIGRLLGHLVIGYEMILRKIREMRNFRGGFPEDLKLQILHLVISHHGELEWGSPVRPMTLEAQILHFADNMDSKVWMFIDARRKRKDPYSRWSEYLQSLKRYVYLGEPEAEEEDLGDALF